MSAKPLILLRRILVVAATTALLVFGSFMTFATPAHAIGSIPDGQPVLVAGRFSIESAGIYELRDLSCDRVYMIAHQARPDRPAVLVGAAWCRKQSSDAGRAILIEDRSVLLPLPWPLRVGLRDVEGNMPLSRSLAWVWSTLSCLLLLAGVRWFMRNATNGALATVALAAGMTFSRSLSDMGWLDPGFAERTCVCATTMLLTFVLVRLRMRAGRTVELMGE